MVKKVLLVIAHEGYQPIEYRTSKKILEEAGHEVITVSDESGTAQAAYDGSSTTVDLKLDEVSIESGDALFFVGGPGAMDYLDNEKSYKLLQDWQASGKPYGAICISPRILAKAGVLKNKKATGWNGDGELEGILEGAGAEYLAQHVVADGNIVTADGPKAAEEFGRKIVEVLG